MMKRGGTIDMMERTDDDTGDGVKVEGRPETIYGDREIGVQEDDGVEGEVIRRWTGRKGDGYIVFYALLDCSLSTQFFAVKEMGPDSLRHDTDSSRATPSPSKKRKEKLSCLLSRLRESVATGKRDRYSTRDAIQ